MFSSITAFLVMSILSACMCLPLMFFASVGVADAQFSYNGYNPYQDVQSELTINLSKYHFMFEYYCRYTFKRDVHGSHNV